MNSRQWATACGIAGMLLAGAAARAEALAQLSLSSDADCTLQVNGRAAGTVTRAQPRVMRLAAGTVSLSCQGTASPEAREQLQLTLRPGDAVARELRVRWVDLGAAGLKDRHTGLQWTRADNGQDVDWREAQAWCAGRGAGWRLPTRAELEALFDSGLKGETVPCLNAKCRVPASFQLSGSWQWSGQAAEGGEKAWYLYLSTGHPQTSAADYKLNARALCVHAGE